MAGHEKAAYMAGVMDGEGSFSITKHIEPTKNTGKMTHNFIIFCGFTMTDARVGRWALDNFGGHFNRQKYNKAKPWHKDAWRWRIGSGKRSNLESFLLAIIPYLILKREQAQLMLDFCRLPHGAEGDKDAIIEQLRVLNRRGKSPEANTPNDSKETAVYNPHEYRGTCRCAQCQEHFARMHQEESKIESELTGDRKSATEVIQ